MPLFTNDNAVISPLAMVGAVMFGLSVRLLLLSAGTANPQSIEAMKSVLTLAKGVLLFGLAMVVYTMIAPIAMVGAILFGLTLRLMFMAMGSANKAKTDQMNAVLSLAKGILLFALAMALRIKSTARSPASVSTPASAYDDFSFPLLKADEPLHQLQSGHRGLCQILPAHVCQVLLHLEVRQDRPHQNKLGISDPWPHLWIRLTHQVK